jgi:hypothetical protein
MPTNCSTATATLSVQTYAASSADGTGSSSFTPVNCSSLPFSPGFTATALKDTGDEGVKLVTVVTVSAAGAADQTLSLSVPAATLAAYEFNAAKEFGDVVGQAIAQTALLPTPLVGTVSLTGSIAAPTLTITFPAPFALSLVGNINLLANSVTFGNVPDVPLSTLTVTLNGGSQALYYTTCAQPTGAVTAGFTGQSAHRSPSAAARARWRSPPPARPPG